jgi:hypothetical protein
MAFYVDMTLLSIAIVFPLVFSIRGSFRRREKALEHLSKFRSTLKTVEYYVHTEKKISDHIKKEMTAILLHINESVLQNLKSNSHSAIKMDDSIHQVQQFVIKHRSSLSSKTTDRILRFKRDIQDSLDNLHAINTHRTPRSLKAYCLIFIFLFPLIYAPVIITNVGTNAPGWVVYIIVGVTEFILISLYNIQDQLEYPFDNYGLDDINLEAFKISRK